MFERDITVRHIAEFDFEMLNPGTAVAEALRGMVEKDFDVMAVRGDGTPTSFITKRDLQAAETVATVTRPITSVELLSADTPLLLALRAFRGRDWYFVLRNNEVAGIVTQADLRKTPVQLFLFGMVLLFESTLQWLIVRYWGGESWQTCLTKGRLQKAQELLVIKKRRNDALGLIDCVNLIDKGTIAQRTPAILDLLAMSPKQAQELLVHVEALRNDLAHAADFLHDRTWANIMALVDVIETFLQSSDSALIL